MSARIRRPGFTLVEMLVVLGIIAVLAALVAGAVMTIPARARATRTALEVKQLEEAIEQYKQDKGDYPPNFRDYQAFLRHVRRCYPKIDNTHLNTFIQGVWGTSYSLTAPPPVTVVPNIDEGESLVFWLSMIDGDQRLPFKAALSQPASSLKKYYPFEQIRLVDESIDTDAFPSFRPSYAKDTFYIYIDSRSYDELTGDLSAASTVGASAEDPSTNFVRPYWSDTVANASATTNRAKYAPMNPTTFQIICAGGDGLFGVKATDVKRYPSGASYDVVERGDHDNITNFSSGQKLEDAVP